MENIFMFDDFMRFMSLPLAELKANVAESFTFLNSS